MCVIIEAGVISAMWVIIKDGGKTVRVDCYYCKGRGNMSSIVVFTINLI